jgi:deoxycytidine triphosphate deaminase
MPILNRNKIRELIDQGVLIRDPLRLPNGDAAVEAASYDLRAGIVLWKDRQSGQLIRESYDEKRELQPIVTLQPGQMVFVITHEELDLPCAVCGTVYSRNKLQKANVLALNAGHVDPGYAGPILIRLINLGAQEWALQLGDAVFTVTFHTVTPSDDSSPKDHRSKGDTLTAAMDTAVRAFSNPFHDLYRDEINRQLNEHYAKVESDIRLAIQKDYFKRDELGKILFGIGTVLLAFLFVISRMPWDKIWVWVNRLFG